MQKEKTTKTKDLHYKKAELTGGNESLQYYIEAILKQNEQPEQRLEKFGSDNDGGRVILEPTRYGGTLCAILGTYTTGMKAAIVAIMKGERKWPIHTASAPKIENANETEFLEGCLYLCIKQNHVIMLQPRSISSRELECHLHWLLKKHPDWPQNGVINLNDLPPSAFVQKKLKHIQAFTMTTEMLDDKSGAKENKKTTEVLSINLGATIWEEIKRIITHAGGQFEEDFNQLEDVHRNDISVRLEVTCRKRSLERAGPVLDFFANALRHSNDDSVCFTFEGGNTLKGNELKVKKEVKLTAYDGLFNANDVYKEMHAYVEELIVAGKISIK